METFPFQCPECGVKLRVSLKHAGTTKKCPGTDCGHLIKFPAAPGTKTPDSPPVSPSRKKTSAVGQPEGKRSAAETSSRSAKPRTKSAQAESTKHAGSTSKTAPRVKTPRLQPLPPSPVASRKKQAAKKSSKTQGGAKWLLLIPAVLLLGGAVTFLLPSGNTGGMTGREAAIQAEATESYGQRVLPFFEKYCFDCHGPDLQEEGVRLDNFSGTPDFLARHKFWSKVHQQIALGSMPPSDMPGPEPSERLAVAAWLDQAINHFDCQKVSNPGRVTVHRLNRAEYDNTIRDLLGLDLSLSQAFPSDDVGYGFDNIGDVLSVSPLLMERYLDAAEKAAQAAIVLPESLKVAQNFEPKDFRLGGTGTANANEIVFASNGHGTVQFTTRAPGVYRFSVTVSATQAGKELAKCEIRLNNKPVATHEIPGHRQNKKIDWTEKLTAGRQELRIAFNNDHYDPEAEDPKMRDRNLFARGASVSGPDRLLPDHFPISHRQIVTHHPDDSHSPEQAARLVLQPLASRAFRRPATIAEMDRLIQIFQLAQSRSESYERSLQICLQAMLVSPRFLFRFEELPESDAAREIQTLGDYELASRLSYFLWSSLPDAVLFDLAAQGQLQNEAVLKQQVQRMLQDPRAKRFVENFVGQWLGLRKLGEVKPDEEMYPEFTPKLAAAMSRETELLFVEVLEKDHSLMELMTADFTFINEPLAKLYGIPGVKGDEFRRVELADHPRRGFILHAGILTLTSFPDRTSPVKRGEWVLENVLAQAPPAAPANVPGLEETQKANPNMSFREQLVLHQKDPVCSSCHKLMDGIGFGLQNFDAIGRWREQEGEFPIDSRGDLPDGTSFAGPLELIKILGQRPDDFARCITEKMLTYSLGRGLEWYDKCTVDDIVSGARSEGYRLSSVITGIVLSSPFRQQNLEKTVDLR